MNRNPPNQVKRILRQEIGFGCPVPECGRPYLEWHHFDPPWSEENHHNPEGMIALCREHHIQADNGAFTKDQLHEFKKYGRENWVRIQGKFNWMRNRLLVCVEGNFYYDTPMPIQYREKPLIWLNRNEDGYLLINIDMLTKSKEPRAYIRDNEWFNVGLEEDIICPPSAKRLDISYPNGDHVNLEFFELENIEQANKRFPGGLMGLNAIEYPVTTLEITMDVADSGTHIKPLRFGYGNFAIRCSVGYKFY